VYEPLNQGAVVDVGVRVATLAVLRKASVFQFFCQGISIEKQLPCSDGLPNRTLASA
jgi:hypothetical protein